MMVGPRWREKANEGLPLRGDCSSSLVPVFFFLRFLTRCQEVSRFALLFAPSQTALLPQSWESKTRSGISETGGCRALFTAVENRSQV